MKLARLSLATLILFAACTRSPPPESTSFSFVDSTAGAIETGGVRIELAPSVHFRFVSHSTSARVSTRTSTLNGHPFGVRAGVFFIGEREYGPVPAGTRVRVSAEGVFFGEEPRGAVPAAKPDGAEE